MLIRKHLLGSFIVLLIFFSMIGCEKDSTSPTKPLTQPSYGTVEGIVYFSGTTSTVPGVLVVCGDVSATTANDGKFSLKNVPSGYQTLKANKTDYNPYARNIEVVENTIVRFDIDMISASSNKSLRGTVYQKDNLQPLDQMFELFWLSDTTFTDAFGKYQLPIILQGLKTIKAERNRIQSIC